MSFVADLRVVLRGRDFRHLFGTRLVSQFSDGIFQFAVTGFAFFSPESQTTALQVAAGLAVLLLPYSLLGPFVGVFIDRWPRRQVLVLAPVARGALLLVAAWLVAADAPDPAFYAAALAVLAVNRFFLAALGASLPHVVPTERLLSANAVVPTSGTVVTFVGVGVGFLLRSLVGGDDSGVAVLLVVSGVVFALSSLIARRMERMLLGPWPDLDQPQAREALRNVVVGLTDGARHLLGHRIAAGTMGAMAAHRFFYGIATALGIILYRYYFTDGDPDAALKGIGLVVATSGVGYFVAVLITPYATERFTIERWVPIALTAAGVLTAVLVLPFQEWGLAAAGFVLGVAGQSVKICADTTVQRDVSDIYRGRAFSIYDMLFNGMYVLAAALSAAILPADGKSYLAVAIMSVGYPLAALAYRAIAARSRAELGRPGPPSAELG
ncbi:MFS transporter [Nonomuraea wenchangensis]|uniref:Predicted arabinose efflux permease, MFS family n=1 Tax=Nonomuraea wenchangensis TaxID=568860 RepID=A0A1I0L4J1_9ACTN|nr:MFS transporter [Nonomuraea wenchangensis]SEU33790.1 Predicted arabinose efflux permease, MFS family [Nonomuraea wenchangensis]